MRKLMLSVAFVGSCTATLFAAPVERVVPRVDAHSWFTEFRDNYIAAERKYPAGSRIVIKGVVNEIKPPKYSVPGLDDPDLTFGGPGFGWWVWASVSRDYAATVRPGQLVVLGCEVMSYQSGDRVYAGAIKCSPVDDR
jgi:hypothetical protein